MLEALEQFKAIVLDYSILFEHAGTSVFDELFTLCTQGTELYVSKAFKELHYCSLHQSNQKSRNIDVAMKKLLAALLPAQRLHLIRELDTESIAFNINRIDNCCVLTTNKGLFYKRIFENDTELNCPIAVVGKSSVDIYPSSAKMIETVPHVKVNKLAFNNTYIDSFGTANVGDIVTTPEGKQFELVKRMSGGAEGMVFVTNKPGLIAKIYHKGIITPLRWAKLIKLASLGINSAGFCVPRDLLYFNNTPVGYTMSMGKGTTLGSVFDGPDAIIEAFPYWTRIDVVKTLLLLIEKYLYLHMHGVVAGDIQLKNALIKSESEVFLIDMDSVQVSNLPCPVGTEEFTDPRLWGKDFAHFVRTLRDEDYSIAMLVFSVLFYGLHPYATRNGAETLREEILERNFPYTMDNKSEFIPLGGYNHVWEYLPDYLRSMLYETFRNGKTYEAVQWLDACLKYLDDLKNYTFDDSQAYVLFPKMDYEQATVDVEEMRKKATGTHEVSDDFEAAPAKPVYERKVFANAPTGKFTPKSSVYSPFAQNNSQNPPSGPFAQNNGQNQPASPFKPINPSASGGNSSNNTARPSGANVEPVNPIDKKRKFFGLF